MSKDSEEEEQRRMESEGGAEQEQGLRTQGHTSLRNREIQVFSGGDGTLLNRAMFAHFNIEEELTYEEKQEQLNRNINDTALAEEDKRGLYDSVRNHIEEAVKSGNLTDVKPEQHETDENSVSYDVGGDKLGQTELDGGMFKFSPEGKFTGVLRVERRDANGELLPNSADIIEYKDGKPVSVIPGPEGETRVADFGLISREAGISVSRVQEKEEGISVSKAVKKEGAEKSLTKDSSEQKSSGLLAIEGAPDSSKSHSLVSKEGNRKPIAPEVMLTFKNDIFAKLSEGHRVVANRVFNKLREESEKKQAGAIVPVGGKTEGHVTADQKEEFEGAAHAAADVIEGAVKELEQSNGELSKELKAKVERGIEGVAVLVLEDSVIKDIQVVNANNSTSRSPSPTPKVAKSQSKGSSKKGGGVVANR
jgi:hypothetical protein